jgi:hypothetical protein
MKTADDVQALYDQAAEDLRAGDDPRLEELKWRIARSELYDPSVKPESLAERFQETLEWGVAAFAALRAGGFIQHQLTYFTWARLDFHMGPPGRADQILRLRCPGGDRGHCRSAMSLP